MGVDRSARKGRLSLKLKTDDGKEKIDVDGKTFFAMPHAVMKSAAYIGLSNTGVRMLLELAWQYDRTNNGQFLLTSSKLKDRGIRSADTITRARLELLAAGLIFETVKGERPNKASWFAATWWRLNPPPRGRIYDPGAEARFKRGAYNAVPAKPLRKAPVINKKGARSTPNVGIRNAEITPTIGIGEAASTPIGGAIKATSGNSPTPMAGNHLRGHDSCVPASEQAKPPKGKPGSGVKPKRGAPRRKEVKLFGAMVPRMVCGAVACTDPLCRALPGEPHASGCPNEACPICSSARWHLCNCGREGKKPRYLGKTQRRSKNDRDLRH